MGEEMKVTDVELAYQMRTLFEQKITSYYFDSFKGSFGRVQAEVLSYLYDHGETSAAALAEAMNVPKQHISKIVHRLVEEGRLESKTAPSDKRMRSLSLSAEGRMLVRGHIENSNLHFHEATSGLTTEEKEELIRSMESIIRIMNKI